MFKVDPETLYSLEELREKLHGIVELPTLLKRLGLKEGRVFRDAIWGWELIEASKRSSTYGKSTGSLPYGLSSGRGQGKTKNTRARTNSPLRPLKASDLDD